MPITVSDYFMGRDAAHGAELTDAIKRNAAVTVHRVNKLLARAAAGGVAIEANPVTGTPVSSGWRPAAVNAATPGAAPRSKHMSAEACDVFDPDGDLDDWCMSHPDVLEECQLWLEHPSATKGWCHLQTIPPRSGKRAFFP